MFQKSVSFKKIEFLPLDTIRRTHILPDDTDIFKVSMVTLQMVFKNIILDQNTETLFLNISFLSEFFPRRRRTLPI